MARMKRVVVPGYPHHIVQRGVRSMEIFFDEQDHEEKIIFPVSFVMSIAIDMLQTGQQILLTE